MRNLLNKLIRAIHLCEDTAIVLLTIAILAMSCSGIVMRNLNLAGISWTDNAVRIAVLWVAIFGALRASREQNHISIDLIGHYSNQMVQRLVHLIISISSTIICSIGAYYSTIFVISEREMGEFAFLHVPTWLCEAIIPFGLMVMALRFLVHSLTLPTPHEHTV